MRPADTVVAKPQSSNKKKYKQIRRTRRQWSNLPQDLLNLIINRLFFTDRIRFRAVCKDWHIIPIGSRPVNEVPWVMSHTFNFDPRSVSAKKAQVMLSDPVYKKTHTIANFAGIGDEYLNCFVGARICASKCGWLLLVNFKRKSEITLFLYSPFTNNVIMLPTLYALFAATNLYKATFSSGNPTSADCVFVIAHYGIGLSKLGISMYRNSDNKWISKIFDEDFEGPVESLVYTENDVCYFVFKSGKLGAFCVMSQEWSWLVVDCRNLIVQSYHMHLVEFNGDLLLAKSNSKYDDCDVFRYDENKRGWIKQKGLGDRALFIGYSSYIRPAIRDTANLADNIFCSYYTCCYRHWRGVIVHSLKDGKQFKKNEVYDWIVEHSPHKVLIEPPY